MGDISGTEPHFSGEPGFGHLFEPWGRGHDFAFRHNGDGRFRGRGFDRNDRFSTATGDNPALDRPVILFKDIVEVTAPADVGSSLPRVASALSWTMAGG